MSPARVSTSVAVAALLLGALRQALPQTTNLSGPFYLERSPDSFGIRSHGIIERTISGSKFFPLPQSNAETYERLRESLDSKDYRTQEVIGPYQVEGRRIWFGKQYYDGEGERGVGAFGYFDMEARKYMLFSPPEVARWEVSAILVEENSVWLALDHFGEDISTSPGGLIRWDPNDHRLQNYPLEFVVQHIRRDARNSSRLVLTTRGGYALLRDRVLQRFQTQKSVDGKETAIRIDRFPPPPSHQ